MASKFGLAGMALASLVSLGGCVDGYGYSGVSVGYSDGGYYNDGYYNAGYYGGYDAGYYGWYGDYYYPGSGYYVYDRYRRPHRWNESQRHYWEGRRGNGYGNGQPNWGHFDRSRGPGSNIGDGYRGRDGYRGGSHPETRANRPDQRPRNRGDAQTVSGQRPHYDVPQGGVSRSSPGYTARDLGRSGIARDGRNRHR